MSNFDPKPPHFTYDNLVVPNDPRHRDAIRFASHLFDEALDGHGMPITTGEQVMPMYEIVADELVRQGFPDETATAIADYSYLNWTLQQEQKHRA